MARLIVDGNNVMGSRPDGWWRDRPGAARRLADEIAAVEQEAIVVFDGPPSFDAPHVLFSGPQSADDVIEEMADASSTVVTSDRELAARVRAHGASVIGAGTFLTRLSQNRHT